MAITACSPTNTGSPNVTSFPARVREEQSSLSGLYDTYLQGADNNNNYNNNYNNRVRARERESLLERETRRVVARNTQTVLHGDFAQAYEDALCRPMPRYVAGEIESMMQRGVSSTLILAVIEYTASAPRPSWAYARAVILRSFAKGINDDEDFYGNLGR